MNYFERHIGDYLKDTSHLSLLEHGVYTRLLDVYYTREGAIPEDQVARLIGARSKDEREAMRAVLQEFFRLVDGAWTQARCEREIARFKDKQEKARRSADARWNAQRPDAERNANASANAMRTHSEGNAPRARPQTPVTSNQTPEREREASQAAPPALSRTGTRLQPAWQLPDEWRVWCTEHRPDLNPTEVADRFRDFWVAKPGKEGRKADWQATWRNWCRAEKAGQINGAERNHGAFV